MSEEIQAKIIKFVEGGGNKLNPQAFDEFYTQESIRHSAPLPDIKGLEDLKNATLVIRNSLFYDVIWTIHEIVVDGNGAASRWTWEGKHTGKSEIYPDIPSGKQVKMTGCTMYHFKEGKCIEEWECGDYVSMMQQLGIIPSSG